MKRQERIQRLVTVGHNVRELDNLSNEGLRVIYENSRPLFEKRAAEVEAVRQQEIRAEKSRRAKIIKLERLQARVAAARLDSKRQEDWMRRCVKVPFPKIQAHWPNPKLDFGLAQFLAYCKEIHANEGNQDAAAVLRVISTGRWGAR